MQKPLGLIEGLDALRLPGEGAEIDTLVGGSGPPLLLLHGYPQTRVVWRQVALRLAEHFTLVIPDLRGYGRSEKPACRTGALYTKRLMALDQIAVMKALGFQAFMVAGHDRGGRVAYRMALDAPECVQKLVVLDIIPTADIWRAPTAATKGLFHWQFLAQPYPMPEKLLTSKGDYFFTWLFETAKGKDFVFDPENMEDYLSQMKDAACVAASCSDYRAGAGPDIEHDDMDRGSNFLEMPLLVLWGSESGVHAVDPLSIWKKWARQVEGYSVPGGHFLPEEASEHVAHHFRKFFLE